MQEFNNELTQYKYEEMDRPMMGGNHVPFDNYGKHMPYEHHEGGWNKPWHGNNWYGPKWPYPYLDGAYIPGAYYGNYGWPWFLFALNSLSPRDASRFVQELEGMDHTEY